MYGIIINQDYRAGGEGGPTGIPTNGVRVENIVYSNVTGRVRPEALGAYILCGEGSCSRFEFDDVDIQGGKLPSSCNYPLEGCPAGVP